MFRHHSRRQAAALNPVIQAACFRKQLRRDGMIIAPGAYDCITARMIARAGFDCVYMTGAGTAATPDSQISAS